MNLNKDKLIVFLRKHFKKYSSVKNIALYPYGDYAKLVHTLILKNFPNIKIKYIFDNYLYYSNPNIKPGSEINKINENDIDQILICTISSYFEIMRTFPRSLIFKAFHFIPYNFDGKEESIKARNYLYEDNGFSDTEINHPCNRLSCIAQFSTLNLIKENNLKLAKDKRKIRVCFFIRSVAKLSFLSVYYNMVDHPYFDPFCLFYDEFESFSDENYKERDLSWKIHKEDYQYLVNKNLRVYDGFDSDRNLIPISDFKPDIIFTSDFLESTERAFSHVYLNTNYLVCYVNYALNTINFFDYHYNNLISATGWKFFVNTRDDFLELLAHSKFFGTNAVLSGYPKFDEFSKPLSLCTIPSKINNGKPIVIYAPHHSVESSFELGTFHFYYRFFLELVKNNPNINFVIKPHPSLKYKLENINFMTNKEYYDYINEWESYGNGICVDKGDYIDLFRKAELLIQDSGSFIGEWLPTLKPCIYLFNPKKTYSEVMNSFSDFGKKVIKTYYCCWNSDEILEYFNTVIYEKKDSLLDKRKQVLKGAFINFGIAGKKIVEHLESCLEMDMISKN